MIMYCPQCATPNADDVKFCRSCGRELEMVALALSGKSTKPLKADANQDWMEKRIEGVSGITRGSILLAVSFLIGAAIALFIPTSFEAPWILIWMVFFGWMAVWGGIEIAYGISGVFEAKSRLRMSGVTSEMPKIGATTRELLSGRPQEIANAPTAVEPATRMSVTEGTTRHLDDYAER
jgi:zinc ribbon protein